MGWVRAVLRREQERADIAAAASQDAELRQATHAPPATTATPNEVCVAVRQAGNSAGAGRHLGACDDACARARTSQRAQLLVQCVLWSILLYTSGRLHTRGRARAVRTRAHAPAPRTRARTHAHTRARTHRSTACGGTWPQSP